MTHQKNTPVFLSICIPTFQQPKEIKGFLESFIPQATSEVEVVIVDDSKDDATEKIVRAYQDRAHIRYEKGERRGIDRAIIKMVTIAQGKYIWSFGDESFDKGAVAYVLNLLRQYPDMAVIWVNSRERGEEHTAMDFGADKLFKDANEMIAEIGTQISFISATIFRREGALLGLTSAERYVGSLFVHLYLVLSTLSRGGSCYYVRFPYVLGDPRDPNAPPLKSSANDTFKVFAVNLYEVMTAKEFAGKFSRKSVKKALAASFGSIWRGILVFRAKGSEAGLGSRSSKIPALFRLYYFFPEFWIALPLLCIPRVIDRYLYKFYKAIF